jgi:hypothetical protein
MARLFLLSVRLLPPRNLGPLKKIELFAEREDMKNIWECFDPKTTGKTCVSAYLPPFVNTSCLLASSRPGILQILMISHAHTQSKKKNGK